MAKKFVKSVYGAAGALMINSTRMVMIWLQQRSGQSYDKLARQTPSPETLDEVSIHVRTGDIARQKHDLYGLVPFHVYPKYIPAPVKTIGIVTAPFNQKRDGGHGDADLNQAVIEAAQEYLQKAFPKARISIRDDDHESMNVTYARMIKANVTIYGPSTFCLFPAIACLGKSYVLHSPLFRYSPSWIDTVALLMTNVHYVDEKYLPPTDIYDLNVTTIVKMLRREEKSPEKPES
jgi:hypothetical protein